MRMRCQPNPPRSAFRGNELLRLITMVVMLGVIFLLIARSRDPNTWTWLTNGVGASNPQNSPAAIKSKSDGNRKDKQNDANKKKVDESLKQAETGKSVESNESAQGQKAKEALPEPGEATDLDSEEFDAFREDFSVITDGSLSIPEMEMRAYNRLLGWVRNQTTAEMRRRAKKAPVYTQFYQSPEKYRGQLFEMELNVRRILDYKHMGLKLYEVWGWTEESRSWPYVGVVLDLPKGMPIGADVYEQVTLVGYFFKMQGYMEAGAKPRAAPLQAPLFVGRLIWRPAVKPQARPSDWTWGIFLLAGFVIFLIIRWGLLLQRGRRRLFESPKLQAKSGGNPVEDWLEKVETDETAQEDNSQGD
jgi:hypothetical protein